MSTRESHAPGTPSWLDLATTDMEGAKAFYGALFGWEFFTEPDPEAGGYTMAMLDGKAAAAMMPQPQDMIDMGIPPCWNIYATVEAIGSEVVNEPGAFTWAELQTNDQAGAAEFYGKVLGITSEAMDMGDMGSMLVLKAGENDVATAMDLMMDGVPPHWGAYFGVADTDAKVAQVTELGGSVLAPPMDIPPGRMAVLADPAGAVFSIIALAG